MRHTGVATAIGHAVVRSEGKGQPLAAFRREASVGLRAPSLRDIGARLAANAEFIIRDAEALAARGRHHAPHPPQGIGIAGPVHDAVAEEADSHAYFLGIFWGIF